MFVEEGDLQKNLDRIEKLSGDAARHGCQIVVFPECSDIGWTCEEANELASPIPGPSSDLLCELARSQGIYMVTGLTECADDSIFNSAVLISKDGEILLKHRKINILSIARALYSIGDRLSVADTEFGKIGVNICADNFMSTLHLAESLIQMGATLILSPLWEESYSSLTSDRAVSVVGVSNVGWIRSGAWEGRKCIGCSLAMGPGGETLARGSYGVDAESLIVAEIPVSQGN
jgi:predicted amidohydrolase